MRVQPVTEKKGPAWDINTLLGPGEGGEDALWGCDES